MTSCFRTRIAIQLLAAGGAAGAVALLASVGVQGTQPKAPPSEVPIAMLRELRQAIDDWAASPAHHGVSASVVLADGAQWSDVAGHAGPDEPLEAHHLIAIASITKTMTAAVILQLVDEGVLRLDDHIGRWLPARRNISPAITVRQLLNHTSGVANYTTSPALATAITLDPTHVFTADELLDFVDRRRFLPGAGTEYTNTSFVLLGQIAERATKRSIVDLYRQRLWSPLELRDIFLPGLEEPPGPVADALRGTTILAPLDHMALLSVGHSAFGLMSNAATVARWGRGLFASDVLSDDMQVAMRTLVPAAGNIPGETGSGLGIRSYHYLDRTQFGHSGGAAFGSSLLLFDPATGVTVVVIMNQGQGAGHFQLAPQLLEIATRAVLLDE